MQFVPDLSFLPMRWVLIGGLALRAYMPERMTQDVDILIPAADEAAARIAFQQAGYRITGDLSIGGFTAAPKSGPNVDVISGHAPWINTALAAPSYDPAGYPVLPRPFLILMKLEAGRGQDVADVQRMLGAMNSTERASTRQVVVRYLPDAAEDYDSLVTLADLEFG